MNGKRTACVAFAGAHWLATVLCLFVLFSVGQYTVDSGGSLPVWYPVLGVCSVVLSLPLAYPLLVIGILGAHSLVILIGALAINSAVVVWMSRTITAMAHERYQRRRRPI